MNLAGTRTWITSGALISLFCSMAAAQQGAAGAPASLDSILHSVQVAQAAVKPQVSYQIIREYRLSGSKNSKADSQVVVEVDFKPPSSEAYTIQSYSGSSRGQQLVRNVLNHEIEVTSRNSKTATAISQDNYLFSYAGEQILDGKACYVLGLTPKRSQSDLISGQMWIDKQTFLVRQVQGDLEKSPSWWIRKIHLKLTFADLEGIWMQTTMEAIADVRIVGSHTLTSRVVDYRRQDEVAVTPLLEVSSQGKR